MVSQQAMLHLEPGIRAGRINVSGSAANAGDVLLAAIDIGTNSIHMVLATVDPQLRSFSVVLTEKYAVRLGDRDPRTGSLTDGAMDRGVQALRHCRELADSHGAAAIVSVATSAVREAGNGRAFLDRVERELGIQVGLVDGNEEARLIYLGVLSAMDFEGRPHLILDIGGGSTELILSDGQDIRSLNSLRIGAVRLLQEFDCPGPIPPERLQLLKAFIQDLLEPAVTKVQQRLADHGPRPVLVGTSGTILAVAGLLATRQGAGAARLNGCRVQRNQLQALMAELAGMTVEQRQQLPGLSERRADIIVTGGLILQCAMEQLQAQQITTCERALREGLIVDWMLRHNLIVDRFAYQSSIRRRTILHQARKYGVDVARSERVAAHALTLFAACGAQHATAVADAGGLLWAAALLHSCGKHINVAGYHKHSWYLVRHCSLLGYTEAEHLIVAALARYHRRGLPKKRHAAWQSLQNAVQQDCVAKLSPLLRIAVALDRRPQQVVEQLEARLEAHRTLTLTLTPCPGTNLSLECWSLECCRPQVEAGLGCRLQVEVVQQRR